MSPVNIGGIDVGGDNPCRFIAELSNNHGGSLARCLRMITAAKDAGATFVKTQCFTVDELLVLRGDGPAPEPWGSQGWTMRSLYEKAQTPHDWFSAIAEYCRDLEIPWFSSVFGAESLALLESLGCPAYKIARLDNQSSWFASRLELVGHKPIIVSESKPGESRVIRPTLSLYCPPGYPQSNLRLAYEDFNVGCGCAWQNAHDGFSYHGTDPLPCIVSATLGAKIVEAHFMLRDEPSEIEANVSLDEYQFAEMVTKVRQIEGMMA